MVGFQRVAFIRNDLDPIRMEIGLSLSIGPGENAEVLRFWGNGELDLSGFRDVLHRARI